MSFEALIRGLRRLADGLLRLEDRLRAIGSIDSMNLDPHGSLVKLGVASG